MKRLSQKKVLARLQDIASDNFGDENKNAFEDKFDGNFVSPSSSSDSKSHDSVQEISNAGK